MYNYRGKLNNSEDELIGHPDYPGLYGTKEFWNEWLEVSTEHAKKCDIYTMWGKSPSLDELIEIQKKVVEEKYKTPPEKGESILDYMRDLQMLSNLQSKKLE